MPAQWWHGYAIAGLLILATAVSFWPVLNAEFLNFDDPEVVSRNIDMVQPDKADLGRYWTGPYLQMYTPITYVALHRIALFAGKTTDGQLQPGAFHVANLLVHIISTLWVYAILLLLIPNEARLSRYLASGIGALVFAIHPIQTEAIAWVASFNSLLSGMLSLWAIWHFITYAKISFHTQKKSMPDRNARLHWIFGLLIFALALLSKPSAVVVPAIAGVLAIYLFRPRWKTICLSLLPWLAMAFATAVIAKKSQPVSHLVSTSLAMRPLIAGDSLAFYFSKLFVPINLTLDYGRTPKAAIAAGTIRWTWIVPTLLIILAFAARRKTPALLTGILLLIIAVLPVLGLMPFYYQVFSTVADRYLYIGFIGPALIVAAVLQTLIARLPAHEKKLASMAIIPFLMLGILSFRQSRLWHDDTTLFNHVIAINPKSLSAHHVLGFHASNRNDFKSAIDHFQAALQINPGDGKAEFFYGSALLRSAQPDQAIEHFQNSLKRLPDNPALHVNTAIAYAMTNQFEKAKDHFRQAIKLQPDYPDAEAQLGNVLAQTGDFPGAFEHFQRALELNPNHPLAQRGLAQLQSMKN